MNIEDNQNQKKKKNKKATLTARQAAEYVGISYWMILELVKKKQIPCIDLGKRKLFRKKSLDDWMTKEEDEFISIDELEETEEEDSSKDNVDYIILHK